MVKRLKIQKEIKKEGAGHSKGRGQRINFVHQIALKITAQDSTSLYFLRGFRVMWVRTGRGMEALPARSSEERASQRPALSTANGGAAARPEWAAGLQSLNGLWATRKGCAWAWHPALWAASTLLCEQAFQEAAVLWNSALLCWESGSFSNVHAVLRPLGSQEPGSFIHFQTAKSLYTNYVEFSSFGQGRCTF